MHTSPHPKPTKLRIAILSALFGASAASGIASAQEAPQDKKMLEVIEVTSRQRVESIQNVPIAITAFGALEIQEMGIERPADFIGLTPNVTLTEAQNAGSSFITIRGLSQVRNGESPVAISVDGVLQVSPNQFNAELVDIAQIEVLKGPQGALYGRNAIGGAINITTKMPDDFTTGFAELDLGNGGLQMLTAGISGPVTENFRYRVSGAVKTFDGLIDNVYLNTPVDFQDESSARGRFVWEINETFSADLRLNYIDTDGGALNYVYQPLFGIDDANDTTVDIEANNLGQNERTISSIALKLDWQVATGTATFTAAQDSIEEYIAGDQLPYSRYNSLTSLFGEYVLDGTQTQYLDTNADSYELRFTSDSDSRLRWIAGVYYLQTDRFISSSTGYDLGLGINRIQRDPGLATASNPLTSFLADDNDNTAQAVFAQINYDLTSTTEVTVSGRYDKDEREQINKAPLSFDTSSGEVRKAEFSKFQPKVSIVYKGIEDISLYGSYAQGFRSGGFNQSGVGEAAESVGLVGVNDLYKAEETENVEIGLKGKLPALNAQFNASVFHNTIDNQHYYLFVGDVGAQVLTNIDEVELSGGEIEYKQQITNALSFYVNAGITDSDIKAYSLEPAAIGNKAPYVADYTFNTGVSYLKPVFDGWSGSFRVDWERRGAQYWEPNNTTQRSALNLVSSRVGLLSDDGKWSVFLWAKNLLDEEYNAEYVLGGFVQPGIPRSYGVEVRWDFE
ncbi:TonB-dependent receptor [Alteromonas alba]|uniref:TonB-dependent receptor n=1 Tax=Alteromonas alba TaxID=2079529 RepID=A0A2S9V5B8_9ALTE|nr:TonB-dependent receptor [Alteromonas alba]PRO71642.1 TonB-dependent receptor [Alteromonas alba]